MIVIASRRTLTLAAVGLIALAVALQWAFGFRIGEQEGNLTEMIAWLFYAAAIVLLAAPMGRRRALLAGGLGFILMAWAVHLNARLSTGLDVQFGGTYAWSGSRVLAATLLIGPLLGLLVGILTGLLARFERVRWTPKTVK